MLPRAGERFGPYEILARLGGGGMGVVFRAWDDRLHREVAIKLLHDEFRAPMMRQRFQLEARAASALAHPHICTIFDIGEQDGEPYLVMELLEGRTLKDLIAERACTVEEIVRYGEQIAAALSAAHNKGIIHRDVKPANIFLQQTYSGGGYTVKILDFGLAKVSMALRSGRDSRVLELTSEGLTVGTLAYMSPEQARGEALDARTDLFSLGIVLYEMATRRVPFRGATTALAFEALLGRPPEPIRAWNVTVPREVERIINKLLSKDRNARSTNAEAVAEALQKLLTRGDGEWLRRIPLASVPLVPADDPTLRRGRHRSSEEGRASPPAPAKRDPAPERKAAAPARPVPPESSPEQAAPTAMVLHPRRLPVQENGPKETQFSPGDVRTTKRDSDANLNAAPIQQSREEAYAERSIAPPKASGTQDVTQSRAAGQDQPATVASEAFTPTITPQPQHPHAPGIPPRTDAGVPSQSQTSSPPSSPTYSTRGKTDAGRSVAQNTTESTSSANLDTASVPPALETAHEVGPVLSDPIRRRFLLPTLAIAALAVTLFFTYGLHLGRFGTVTLQPTDILLLTPISNATGNPALDGVADAGLQIETSTRSRIRWFGLQEYHAGERLVGRQAGTTVDFISPLSVAQALHARAYISGAVEGDARLTLHLTILDARTNKALGSVDVDSADASGLPLAIHTAAQQLEQRLGQTQDTAAAQNGTRDLPSVAALLSFNRGEAARVDDRLFDAAGFYRQALAASPNFPLARLRLAWIYAAQGAELAAAESAARAIPSTSSTPDSLRYLAQIARQILVERDTRAAEQTARRAAVLLPNNAEVLTELSTASRQNGHLSSALLAAQQALLLDPYSPSAVNEVALALVGLDRLQEALDVQSSAAQRGVICHCASTYATLLLSGVRPVEQPSQDLRSMWQGALAFEALGQENNASNAWHSLANAAEQHPDLISAASGSLALGALNQALHGSCSEAAVMVHQAMLLAYGDRAGLRLALAAAICHPQGSSGSVSLLEGSLGTAQGHISELQGQLPLVRAVQQISSRQASQAILTLASIPGGRDATPLINYLHGLALKQADGPSAAAPSFQLASERKGYALLTGVAVSRLAEQELQTPPRPSLAHKR